MTTNLQQLNVLLVEDDDIASIVATTVLLRKNCIVTLAINGTEAIEKIKPEHHFCLLDIGLPDFDGFEVTRRIRSGPAITASIPIIALTSHETNEARINLAKNIGMNGFFSKPFSPDLCDEIINFFVNNCIKKT